MRLYLSCLISCSFWIGEHQPAAATVQAVHRSPLQSGLGVGSQWAAAIWRRQWAAAAQRRERAAAAGGREDRVDRAAVGPLLRHLRPRCQGEKGKH